MTDFVNRVNDLGLYSSDDRKPYKEFTQDNSVITLFKKYLWLPGEVWIAGRSAYLWGWWVNVDLGDEW